MNPEIILGPPGTGKTESLLGIMEQELTGGTASHRIAYVSFTRRARREAMERACEKFGLSEDDLPYVRTIHSIAWRWLGLNRDSVLEGNMVREFATWAGVDVRGRWSDDGDCVTGYTQGDRILHMEHLSRVRGVPLRTLYDQGDDSLPWTEVDRVARHLAAFKAARGVLDYTDMLTQFLMQGGNVPLDVLLVDEAQDLSALQWGVVTRLAEGCRRVVISGDDDQAIYGWAGADCNHLITMQGNVRVLGQSHRVPRAVQHLANTVIGRVGARRPKAWAPRDEQGEVMWVPSLDHASLDSGKVLILARNTHVLQDVVVPQLRQQGIWYAWGDRPAVQPAVLDAIKVWEGLRRGQPARLDEVLACYAWGSPGRMMERGHRKLPGLIGQEQVGLGDLLAKGGLLKDTIWHDAMDRLPRDEVALVISARQRGEKLMGEPRVSLSTIHGSKGAQCDHVVLMSEVAKRTWREAQDDPDAEARVAYVGLTRARQKLTIVASRNNLEMVL